MWFVCDQERTVSVLTLWLTLALVPCLFCAKARDQTGNREEEKSVGGMVQVDTLGAAGWRKFT